MTGVKPKVHTAICENFYQARIAHKLGTKHIIMDNRFQTRSGIKLFKDKPLDFDCDPCHIVLGAEPRINKHG